MKKARKKWEKKRNTNEIKENIEQINESEQCNRENKNKIENRNNMVGSDEYIRVYIEKLKGKNTNKRLKYNHSNSGKIVNE